MHFVRLAPLLIVALLAAPALARELPLFGRHPLTGEREGVRYEGWLEVREDGSCVLTRRFADGREEEQTGRLRVEERQLVLAPAPGATSPPATDPEGSAPPLPRYRHDERDGRLVLRRVDEGGGEERIDLGRAEGTLALIGRALSQGDELRWLALRNRGVVEDRGDGLRIERSRQPRPADIVRFKRAGGRAVLSLNGDQDEEASWIRRVRGDMGRVRTVRTTVNLQAFIREQGLEHHWVRMSASRAPTEEQLVAVFRVLLDPSKRPLLLHCTGGADRTGVISALHAIEFLGVPKEEAKRTMRRFMWTASRGTEIQGAVIDLHQRGSLRALLEAAGAEVPARYE